MTKDEFDRTRFGCSEQQHRARLLFCMDYIIHNLNDEEAAVPWLQDGAPDGLYQESKEPPAEEYEDLDLSDDEFYRLVGLFINILALEGGCKVSGNPHSTVGKAVLS